MNPNFPRISSSSSSVARQNFSQSPIAAHIASVSQAPDVANSQPLAVGETERYVGLASRLGALSVVERHPSQDASVFPAKYEMPKAMKQVFVEKIVGSRDLNEAYSPASNTPRSLALVVKNFNEKRRAVIQDANDFFQVNPLTSLPCRPSLPALSNDTSPSVFIDEAYQKTNGIAFGEFHSSIASKKFLIEQMPCFKSHGVQTLYLEHLQSDMHQPDLDTFHRTGIMPNALAEFLKGQNEGHMSKAKEVDDRYNFFRIVKVAQENGMRIIALDCAASYHLRGGPDNSLRTRAKVFSFFASKIIHHDQSHQLGKWVALMGNTHSNAFEDRKILKTIPGIAELNGAISVRVMDGPQDESFTVSKGCAMHVTSNYGMDDVILYPDIVMTMGIDKQVAAGSAASMRDHLPNDRLSQCLTEKGDFLIDQKSSMLSHFSNDGSIKHTTIKKEGGGFFKKSKIFIEYPKWEAIHHKRFRSVDELATALVKENKMKRVSLA